MLKKSNLYLILMSALLAFGHINEVFALSQDEAFQATERAQTALEKVDGLQKDNASAARQVIARSIASHHLADSIQKQTAVSPKGAKTPNHLVNALRTTFNENEAALHRLSHPTIGTASKNK